MRTPRPLSYVLEPRSIPFKADPDNCPHCRRNLNPEDPEYRHRHWRQAEPPASSRQDGPVWRFWFWVYSDWGMGQRKARR